MNTWINGRRAARVDHRDRGLQYGDGLFETMRVRRGRVRLLTYHLDRLYAGCRALKIAAPARKSLQTEIERIAGRRSEGVLKLILTRGSGVRGYRPTGRERCTRIVTLRALPITFVRDGRQAAHIRLCATPIGINPALAGCKTLNRLESVLARAEWRSPRIWEGLMLDADKNIVCGTMSNLFLRQGSDLTTPKLDRCGVAGVMRRWVLETAGNLGLRAIERRIRWQDVRDAEEIFMSNAVVGLRSVSMIERRPERLHHTVFETADRLRLRLEAL